MEVLRGSCTGHEPDRKSQRDKAWTSSCSTVGSGRPHPSFWGHSPKQTSFLIGGSHELGRVGEAARVSPFIHRRLGCKNHHGQRRSGLGPPLAGETGRGRTGGPFREPHCTAWGRHRGAQPVLVRA